MIKQKIKIDLVYVKKDRHHENIEMVKEGVFASREQIYSSRQLKFNEQGINIDLLIYISDYFFYISKPDYKLTYVIYKDIKYNIESITETNGKKIMLDLSMKA